MTSDQAASLQGFKAICGHLSRTDQLRFFPTREVITVLRNPLERCCSWINMTRKDDSLPICDFIQQENSKKNLYNRMVRQLGGHVLDAPEDLNTLLECAKVTLQQAFWVGCQDTLDRDVPLLWQRLGVTAKPLPRLNAGRCGYSTSALLSDRSLCEILKSWNEYDTRLWQWACERIFSVRQT
jgi:hypothetical protein